MNMRSKVRAPVLLCLGVAFVGCGERVSLGSNDSGRGWALPASDDAATSDPLPPGDDTGPGLPASGAFSPIVTADPPPPPIAGGTLLALGDGSALAASDPDRDRVDLINISDSNVRHVALRLGDEPGRIAEDGKGHIHVILRAAGAIATIDLASATVTGRRSVCPVPRGIAWDNTRGQLWVTCLGGELVAVTETTIQTIRTDLDDARDVLVSGTSLIVSRFRSAGFWTLQSADLIPGSPTPNYFAAAPVSGMNPTFGARIAINDGGFVFMVHAEARSPDQPPIDTKGKEGTYGGGPDGSQILAAAISKLDPASGASFFRPLTSAVVPADLAVSGAKIAVAFAGLSRKTAGVSILEDPPGPCPPKGCGGSTPLFPTGQPVAVAFAKGLLAVQLREPATIAIYDARTLVKTITIATDSRRDTGHDIFHANAGVGVACASCHFEGGDDGHVWNFSTIGKRRTQSLRGGAISHPPFHWDGDEDGVPMLFSDIWQHRMGGPVLNSDELAAAKRWLSTLPALPARAPDDLTRIARGKALFSRSDVGCTGCHAGPELSIHSLANVGTGARFKIPSLLGVGYRAPFMHDGCAATLRERLDSTCGGLDMHGTTSALSDTDRDALVGYLRSL